MIIAKGPVLEMLGKMHDLGDSKPTMQIERLVPHANANTQWGSR
jgi:hypothetical protein